MHSFRVGGGERSADLGRQHPRPRRPRRATQRAAFVARRQVRRVARRTQCSRRGDTRSSRHTTQAASCATAGPSTSMWGGEGGHVASPAVAAVTAAATVTTVAVDAAPLVIAVMGATVAALEDPTVTADATVAGLGRSTPPHTTCKRRWPQTHRRPAPLPRKTTTHALPAVARVCAASSAQVRHISERQMVSTKGGRVRGVVARQGPGLGASTKSGTDTVSNTNSLTTSPTVMWAPVPASIRSHRPHKITSGTCRRPRRWRSGRTGRALWVQQVKSPGEVEESSPQQPL